MQPTGKVIIFSAPSGSGKSTIIHSLMAHKDLRLAFSTSCTSRSPRPGEVDGKDYHFIAEQAFRDHIAAGHFLEYEQVYAGRYYGTLRSEVDGRLAKGENVVLDVDVKGGQNIKAHYGRRALSIFIQPPSIAELRRRLESRGTETPEAIDSRIARAEFELAQAGKFDTVITNDNLDTAQQETEKAVRGFLEQSDKPDKSDKSVQSD